MFTIKTEDGCEAPEKPSITIIRYLAKDFSCLSKDSTSVWCFLNKSRLRRNLILILNKAKLRVSKNKSKLSPEQIKNKSKLYPEHIKN